MGFNRKSIFLVIISIALVLISCSVSALEFFDVKPPDTTTSADFVNSGISWRPQGDYAILVSTRISSPTTAGIHRFDYDTETLTYQEFGYPAYNLQRVKFSMDGSFALITGSRNVYRYDHSATGIGAVTPITDIENPGGCSISFYDILRHPTNPTAPLYILANLQCGASHQVRVYRYDSSSSPQLYLDDSGGVSPLDNTAFEPRSGDWQANGDYFVWGNQTTNGWQGRIFVWDPDHSTFPPGSSSNEMQYFVQNSLTNISTISMSPLSGHNFALVKGTNRIIKFTQQDSNMVSSFPSDWHTSISGGDSSYKSTGTKCLFLERVETTPCHSIMVFDENGDIVSIEQTLCGPNFTNYSSKELNAVEWHPTESMGLIAGSDRWVFLYTDDVDPTPVPPIPATSGSGIGLLIVIISLFLIVMKPR